MIASRRLFPIPSFVVLAVLIVALCGCRSSMDVSEGPPAPPPPPSPTLTNPPDQSIAVQPDASVAEDIVYVGTTKDDKITWNLVGAVAGDVLGIQIYDPCAHDPFDGTKCKSDTECSVKLKKKNMAAAEAFKYTIIVHHTGAPDSVNDPVIIWR